MNILEYENYQEKKTHFDAAFPYNTFPCCIPQDFLSVPMHWHDEMEIIYIKKGQGGVSIDLQSAIVSQGDIILVAPGQMHEIFQYQQERMEYENILFDLNMLITKNNDICTTDFFSPLKHSHILEKNIYTSKDPAYAHIAHCLDQMDEICKTFPPAYQLAIKSYLFSMFYELFSNLDFASAAKKPYKSLEKLRFVIKYVENHYPERLTIEQIAKLCDYSPSHFMKIFKNAMGTSFIDYLNDYRLLMSARLLHSSDSTILSISEEVGFENLSYFNRCFKKKFGKTPSAYRGGVEKNF